MFYLIIYCAKTGIFDDFIRQVLVFRLFLCSARAHPFQYFYIRTEPFEHVRAISVLKITILEQSFCVYCVILFTWKWPLELVKRCLERIRQWCCWCESVLEASQDLTEVESYQLDATRARRTRDLETSTEPWTFQFGARHI